MFYPSAEFQQTTRITRVEGEAFKSEGKVLVNAGWLAVYGKEADTEETGNLTIVETVSYTHLDVYKRKRLLTSIRW